MSGAVSASTVRTSSGFIPYPEFATAAVTARRHSPTRTPLPHRPTARTGRTCWAPGRDARDLAGRPYPIVRPGYPAGMQRAGPRPRGQRRARSFRAAGGVGRGRSVTMVGPRRRSAVARCASCAGRPSPTAISPGRRPRVSATCPSVVERRILRRRRAAEL